HPVDAGERLYRLEIAGAEAEVAPGRRRHSGRRAAGHLRLLHSDHGRIDGGRGFEPGGDCRRPVRVAILQPWTPSAHPVRVAGRAKGSLLFPKRRSRMKEAQTEKHPGLCSPPMPILSRWYLPEGCPVSKAAPPFREILLFLGSEIPVPRSAPIRNWGKRPLPDDP